MSMDKYVLAVCVLALFGCQQEAPPEKTQTMDDSGRRVLTGFTKVDPGPMPPPCQQGMSLGPGESCTFSVSSEGQP